ncbi:MAG: NAD(P)H-hydrate epimerase, partial [Flavobacteriales bacterium]|nr:NAD(P)H-hydrate epimerase [Flavobacteriales bacterium]
MIPVLTGQRIREADAATISNEPIASIHLMERAAQGCATWLLEHIAPALPVKVLVGMGNNGGDGLAIARLLRTAGRTVSVVEVKHRSVPSEEQKTNRDRWLHMGGSLLEVEDGSNTFPIADDEVIIDALLGVGLDRPLSGLLKSAVQLINRTPNPVYSIDLPSGLFSEDNSGNDLAGVVQADVVLAIGTPKLALLLPENEGAAHQWVCIPIQLDAKYLASSMTPFALVELHDLPSMLPSRTRFQHKGRSGHALIVAGSPGKWGAAALCAKACARSGVGLISMSLPPEVQTVMLGVLPEVMTEARPVQGEGPSFDPSRFSAVGI